MTVPASDADLRAGVGAALDEFITRRRPALSGIAPEVAALVEAVAGLAAGGKRLRPAFAYWGHLAAGGEHRPALVTACASLELLQACALIHDDVMDASDTRRGKPAAHRAFEAMHNSNAWTGDAAQFGVGAAILAGDLALSWADEMLLTSGMGDAALAAAKPVYDTMRAELMAGQYLDLVEQQRRDVTVERARRVIKYKSAKYSIEQPVLLGAAMAGADDTLAADLSEFGLAVGEAFQLRDDVLGVFGDSATTGKPAGDDLRERKQTVLLAFALDSAGAPLRDLVDSDDDSAAAIAQMQSLVAGSGAVEQVEQMISDAMDAAAAALARAQVPSDAREALTRLAVAATRREA